MLALQEVTVRLRKKTTENIITHSEYNDSNESARAPSPACGGWREERFPERGDL